MRILVSSGTADAINTNHRLRERIAHGFRELGHYSRALGLNKLWGRLEREPLDLLLITGSIADPGVDLAGLAQRAQRRQITVAFWLHDDPYEFDLHWRLETLHCPVFSNEANCLPYYPSSCRARALALAASPLDALSLDPVAGNPDPEADLGFCGVAFPQRVAILRKLAAAGLTLACWGDGWPDDLAGAVNCRLGPLGLRQLYRRCCFVLNLGRDVPIANRRQQIASSMPGPRTFEAALMGAVQLYLGQSPRVAAFYGPGDGVIPASRVEEIQTLVRRGRADPCWRRRLGEAASRHTRRHHLYRHRCHDLLAALGAQELNTP